MNKWQHLTWCVTFYDKNVFERKKTFRQSKIYNTKSFKSSYFFISLIVGRKIDKRDAYWIVYGLVTIDFLCFVAKMDQILT